MHARYASPEMVALFSDKAKLELWAQVTAACAQARADSHAVQAELVAAAVPRVEDWRAAELVTHHDVEAFLRCFTAGLSADAARWVHRGMTSSDIVDTALAVTLRRASDIVVGRLVSLDNALAHLCREHWLSLCMGRTHGVPAHPTTIGHRFARHLLCVRRAGLDLRRCTASITATVSGPVGTADLIPEHVEETVLSQLGLPREPAPSQIVARDRVAALLRALDRVAGAAAGLATEVRLAHHAGDTTVTEGPGGPDVVGSSSMPHKRNPIKSEKICGLSRVISGLAEAANRGVDSWHERDLTNSSAERVTICDAFALTEHAVGTATEVASTLQVHPELAEQALRERMDVVVSAAWKDCAIHAGLPRADAHALVQEHLEGGNAAGLSAAIGIDVPTPDEVLKQLLAVLDRKRADLDADAEWATN